MPPVTLLIKPVSGMCNLRCSYCFYQDVGSNREIRSYGKMSDITLENTVKKALRYADGFCTFGFQGGEPTLAGIDFYRKLIELQKKYAKPGVRIINTIQTNGTLLDDNWAKLFSENNFLVGLSLDGTKETHNKYRTDPKGEGTYDKVCASAKLLDSYDVEYNILCVVNSSVAANPEKVYNELREYGYVQFIPCLDELNGKKNEYSLDAKTYGNFLCKTFDLYYNDFISGDYTSVRTFDNFVKMVGGGYPESCGMSGYCSFYFLIESDGSVYPCDFYALDNYKLGNINDDSPEKMIRSERAEKFVRESLYVSDECRSCKWSFLCRGGCRRNREPLTNGHLSLNVFCSGLKRFFEYSFPRMEDMARKVSKMKQ